MQISATPISRRFPAMPVVNCKESAISDRFEIVKEGVGIFHTTTTFEVRVLAETEMEIGVRRRIGYFNFILHGSRIVGAASSFKGHGTKSLKGAKWRK